MQYRFHISTDGGASFPQQVSPGLPEDLFVWTRDESIGRAPKRMELGGDLQFTGADYRYLLALDEEGTPCDDMQLRVQIKCGASWRTAWTGEFPRRGGRWDRRACRVSVKPEPKDKYTCLQNSMKKKLNMIAGVPATGCEGTIPPPGIPLTREFAEARLLYDVVAWLVSETDCNITGVVSDFFEWNPPGDAIGYAAGINYVTGLTNKVDRLYIDQKSNDIEFIPPLAVATIAELTIADMLGWLRDMFQVYWDVDDDGNLRLEHVKHWDFGPTLDLSGFEVIEALQYEYLKEEIPEREEFEWMDVSPDLRAPDFHGFPIIYPSQCASEGPGSVRKLSLPITTDILKLISPGTPPAPDPKGFAIMACEVDPGNPDKIIVENGAISGNPMLNGPLAWANLHRDYFTWNRYLRSGNMNDADTVFDSFRPNVQQVQVTVKCFDCAVLDFDPDASIDTELSELLGVSARIERAAFGRDGHMRFTLKYPH